MMNTKNCFLDFFSFMAYVNSFHFENLLPSREESQINTSALSLNTPSTNLLQHKLTN